MQGYVAIILGQACAHHNLEICKMKEDQEIDPRLTEVVTRRLFMCHDIEIISQAIKFWKENDFSISYFKLRGLREGFRNFFGPIGGSSSFCEIQKYVSNQCLETEVSLSGDRFGSGEKYIPKGGIFMPTEGHSPHDLANTLLGFGIGPWEYGMGHLGHLVNDGSVINPHSFLIPVG